MNRRLGLLCALLFGSSSCGEAPPPQMQSGCDSDAGCAVAPMLACRDRVCVDPGCPQGSVYVTAARFRQGCDNSEAECDSTAQPAHLTTLSRGFCIAEAELSVGEYRACLDAGKCAPPAAPQTLSDLRCSTDHATWTDSAAQNERMPMDCLLWSEADSACAFLGGRLPSEAEWERAARGDDNRAYPWGRGDPIYCDQGVNFAGVACPGIPWSTQTEERQGAMVRSPFLAFDLGGNLSEWVADIYTQDAYSACRDGCTDPAGPTIPITDNTLRVRRGGSFQSPTAELRTYAREFHVATGPRSDLIGARCAFPPAR